MSTDKTRTDMTRKPKKSETLEVRIPYETKQAFLTACREDGTTASEVVRESVQSYLDERERPSPQMERTLLMKFPEPVRRYGLRAAAGGLAAVGLTTFAALPSAATPDFAAHFKKLDVNGDGVLTAEEFAGPKVGVDKNVVVETRHVTREVAAPQATIAKPAERKEDAFSFWLPDDLGGADRHELNEYKFVTQREIRVQRDGATAAAPVVVSVDDIRKQQFEGFDSDRDGKVSFNEFTARQKAMLTRGFEMLDTNGDKFLNADEYAKIVSPPLPKIAGDDSTDGPRVQIVNGGPKVSAEALKAAFAKLDVNKDNRLSLQEYLPPA